MQRHHLLPRQLVEGACFSRLFARLSPQAVGFEDFRRNGLLLPASEDAARILGLPLHRGPHHTYNAMVIDRVGAIERSWARDDARSGEAAVEVALFRFDLLQRALRRRLLRPGGPRLALNRNDPALVQAAFADLDAMADLLWAESAALGDGFA